MKTYGSLNGFRLLNVKVILDDTQVVFEGMVDNAPPEVLQMKYSKICGTNPMELYVYTESQKL